VTAIGFPWRFGERRDADAVSSRLGNAVETFSNIDVSGHDVDGQSAIQFVVAQQQRDLL
jgi:hypothetical protein